MDQSGQEPVQTLEQASQNGTHSTPILCHHGTREDHLLPCGFDLAQEDSLEELRHDVRDGDDPLGCSAILYVSKKDKGLCLTPSLEQETQRVEENQGKLRQGFTESKVGEDIYATPKPSPPPMTPCLRRPVKPKMINDVVPQSCSVRNLFEQEPSSVARNNCKELVSVASKDRIHLLWNFSELKDVQNVLSPITCSSYSSYGCQSGSIDDRSNCSVNVRSISHTIESSLSDNEIEPSLSEMDGFEICVNEVENCTHIFGESCPINSKQAQDVKESSTPGRNTGKDILAPIQELDESDDGASWTPISGISPIPGSPEGQNGDSVSVEHQNIQCHHYHCHTSGHCLDRGQENMQMSSHIFSEKASDQFITSTPIFSKGGGSLHGAHQISEVCQNNDSSVELMPRRESHFVLTSECVLLKSGIETRYKEMSTFPSSQHADKTRRYERDDLNDWQISSKRLNRGKCWEYGVVPDLDIEGPRPKSRASNELSQLLINPVKASDDLLLSLVMTPRKALSFDESFFSSIRNVPQDSELSKSLD